MIQLTNDLAIVADEYQYILGRPRQRTDKAGKAVTRIDSPRYYTTLTAALKAAVTDALRDGVADGTITTLRGFIAEQQRLQDEFAKLIEPLE